MNTTRRKLIGDTVFAVVTTYFLSLPTSYLPNTKITRYIRTVRVAVTRSTGSI